LKFEKPSTLSDFDWLWVQLSQAIDNCPPGEDIVKRHGTPPWEFTDPAVTEAWGRITAPENRAELESRLRQHLNPVAQAYTQKALEICQQRCEDLQ
jgi:hypothetical protein